MKTNNKKRTDFTSLEVLDIFWDNFKTEEITPEMTWKEFSDNHTPIDAKDYIKDSALGKFLFELGYLFRKPDRSTIKWLFGEHAFLYDVFGCEKHKFVCKTLDSVNGYVENLTLFCPECNKKNFMDEKAKNDYFALINGNLCSDNSWDDYIKMSEWQKKYNRKENFKYQLGKLKDFHYIKYKVIKFFKSVFKVGVK